MFIWLLWRHDDRRGYWNILAYHAGHEWTILGRLGWNPFALYFVDPHHIQSKPTQCFESTMTQLTSIKKPKPQFVSNIWMTWLVWGGISTKGRLLEAMTRLNIHRMTDVLITRLNNVVYLRKGVHVFIRRDQWNMGHWSSEVGITCSFIGF